MNPIHKKIILQPQYNRKRNLLTPNQQTGTDTLGTTTGFIKLGTNTIINSSTEQAHTGTKSLKVITNGDAISEGFFSTPATVATNTPYTAGAWIYAPLGAKITLLASDGIDKSTPKSFTGTGTWQWAEVTHTTDTHTTLYVYIYTTTTPQQITFYTDDLHLR